MNSASASSNGTEGPARWSLQLFGAFELRLLPGFGKMTLPGKRERVLLAYLALSPNYRQPRRKLVTLLWGDAADETTLDNLRNCLWNLRKALGDTEHQVVASDGEDIVLDAAAFDVDALIFRRCAAGSEQLELEAAAALCTGEFLDGLLIESNEFETWRRAEASRYRDQAIDVLTRLMTQFSECGETERAIAMGERILRLEPLHEAAVRRLMRHYGESGRRGAAIQLYRTLAEALRNELDAQPEAETRAVFAEIARGGEERTSGPAADATPPSRSTAIAQLSNTPREPLRLKPMVPALRSRAPLAMFAGVAIVATALISYWQFTPVSSTGTDEAVVAERTLSSSQTDAISIAVLPFANMSGDPGQDFFVDGISEEITSVVASVPSLRVIGRTSAFQFKGQNKDLRAIGQVLGTTHLIEGSVRKVGDRVRITAQLIEVDGGTHLWSENYDRQLTDIFAIQEDIAVAIAGALRVPLGLAPGERLVSNRGIDPVSYQQFLLARSLFRARERGIPQATNILEPLVASNPNYAPALALLGRAYAYVGNLSGSERRLRIEGYWPKAEAAARRAIHLDPGLADAYLALAVLENGRGNLVATEELRLKALALTPNNPEALQAYIPLLANVGRQQEALAMAQQLHAMEPHVPTVNNDVGEILWESGEDAAAIEMLLPIIDVGRVRSSLAMIYASQGRYKEAADLLELNLPAGMPEHYARLSRTAGGILRTAPAKAASPQDLPELCACALGFVYLYVGAAERSLEYYENVIESGSLGGAGGDTAFLWHPSYAPVRKLERFKTFVRKSGLVKYWRVKGWPEFCRPKGADDFVCT